ncbi:MAG: glycosyltransferase family 4 protein [bacterium]|nr:glycosyltransferase family 4 protein [bacterium]
MIIEQFLPAFHKGDAIGNSALSFHRYLREKGIESRLIALTIDHSLRKETTYLREYKLNPTQDSLKILHFAIPSEMTDYFLELGGKKAMIYHNITPAHFFTDYSDEMVRIATNGRKHLERLQNCFGVSIADSAYNAEELEALHFDNVKISPLMVNPEDYGVPYNEMFCRLLRDGRKNIVFVGRITPNKKVEDLIKVLYIYKKYISPTIRLVVTGNVRSMSNYFHAIREMASRFDLSTDDLFFTGHIPFEELLSVYRAGDVFLSMSEHEGFCLPLIESSYFRLPVVAFDAGAVAETLDGSGILFNEKSFENVAGLIERVLYDERLRETLKNLQAERIEKYKNQSEPGKLFDLLRECKPC